MSYYLWDAMMYLFKIWYWKQLLQSGKELRHQSFQCCVEVGTILHWKDILSDYKNTRPDSAYTTMIRYGK